MTKIKYPAPKLPDGRVQQVPIVVKNRDVLLGHIAAVQSILASISGVIDINNDLLSHFDPGLDSTRFNNYIADGVNSANISKEEVEEIMSERIKNILNKDDQHSENNNDILDPGFFSIDCNCGNFVRWNNAKEIPYENFKCDLCDRVLIHYIHLDDEDIEFDEGEITVD